MKPLQLQKAKQQFCAVADKAAKGKPQVVTKHGKPLRPEKSIADLENFANEHGERCKTSCG